MVVTVQSGSTAIISAGKTVKSPTVQNAGTVTNAGTIQQSKSNVATGTGSGIGSAITQFKRFPVAVGTGLGLGKARTSPLPFPRATGTGSGLGKARTSPLPFPRATGTGLGLGKARTSPIPPRATGTGSGLGSAIEAPIRSSVAVTTVQSGSTAIINAGVTLKSPIIRNAGTVTNAGTVQQLKSGTGSSVGSAVSQRQTARLATGTGSGIGSAITQFKRLPVATGSGLGAGSATTTRFEQISASGIGLGFGSATNPEPFDPIRQIVRLLESTNETAWRYGKPERIAPIWEYSHNDRVNYPDPALYIYTPAESVVDKFGIEGDNFNQTITIEILIMTLESSETQGYVGDTTTLITQLFDDNAKNSNFHRFSNVNAADLRNEHITQQTDHYIGTVTFEIQRFAAIPALQSVGEFR